MKERETVIELANGSTITFRKYPGTTPLRGPSVNEHPVLGRLLDEVREESVEPHRYDRIHNRHNRGR